jgi:hypothetical protein
MRKNTIARCGTRSLKQRRHSHVEAHSLGPAAPRTRRADFRSRGDRGTTTLRAAASAAVLVLLSAPAAQCGTVQVEGDAIVGATGADGVTGSTLRWSSVA